jgi:hypothetical protein
MKMAVQQPITSKIDFTKYFKVGVSPDYILIRDDFPMKEISPGDFARLTKKMFRKNDEVLNAGK